MYGDFISLLTCAPSEKKWEVFAQFWEAGGSKTSHMAIDYQRKDPKIAQKKKFAQLEKGCGNSIGVAD